MQTKTHRLNPWLPAALLLALAGCRPQSDAAVPAAIADPAPEAASQIEAPAAPPADLATAEQPPETPADFDVNSVPVTTAALPPFPFFATPEGLKSRYNTDHERNIAFDATYFIAGDKPKLVEGKMFRDRFWLKDLSTIKVERPYSALEFHRNYADAIAALGGRKINTVQWTSKVKSLIGDYKAQQEYARCGDRYDFEKFEYYLIRGPAAEYWIEVKTAGNQTEGCILVLEKQVMQSKLSFLDASAMKKAIDADGRVALHINFDVDKATLRADAQPVVEEINKLLTADPELQLSIEGHTDNTGDAEHNRKLSAARARSVLGALVGLGIDPSRLASNGFGADKPVADNGSEDGKAKNRRVELVKR